MVVLWELCLACLLLIKLLFSVIFLFGRKIILSLREFFYGYLPIAQLHHFKLQLFLWLRWANLAQIANKTAGHHREIYSPLTQVKIPFRRMKAFFFLKKYYLQQILIIFPYLQFFWFLQKTSNQVKKANFIKYYHLMRIFQQICHLYRFLRKKTNWRTHLTNF